MGGDFLWVREPSFGASPSPLFHPSVEQKDVELVRDEARQIGEMKVPKDALNGHAFHTYTVTSPDGSGACSGP